MTVADKPIPFELHRDTDVSGVSGTGKVAEGAIFSDGEAVIHWLGQWPTTTPHPKGITSIRAVHGHGGATRVVLPDDPSARLARIAEAHSKSITGGGMTDGDCVECGHRHPCPTYTWATANRDPLATWDPADDEPAAGVRQDGVQPPADPVVCEGFVWMGQPFTTCDRCGQPAWVHKGLDVAAEEAGPFDTRGAVRPWEPGEADAIRAKWEQPTTERQDGAQS